MSSNRTPTSVEGVLAGHHTDAANHTGVTVLLFPNGAVGAVWVPGSATGSRELGVLGAGQLAPHIHGLCLAGGSAFGLAAADGVVQVLAERGIGFPTPHGPVPIVPAAILYDLHTATVRPNAAMGEAAARAASTAPLPQGRLGAGAGAQVASISGSPAPGGVGCGAEQVGGDRVAAVAAVNALGAIRDPETGAWIAGGPPGAQAGQANLRGQTTLVAVVVDAPLSRDGATVVAKMATAGLARTVFPAFSPFDGDIVFVASTNLDQPAVDAPALLGLGAAAARCVARAVVAAVRGSADPSG